MDYHIGRKISKSRIGEVGSYKRALCGGDTLDPNCLSKGIEFTQEQYAELFGNYSPKPRQ
jgi:hypothetical protein